MKNYTITVNGSVYDVVVEEGSTSGVVPAEKTAPVVSAPKVAKPVKAAGASTGAIKVEAGTAGKVFKIEVEVGQTVKSGDSVVILEAMKMEIPVVAPQDGTVASIDVSDGESIEAGAVLVTLN